MRWLIVFLLSLPCAAQSIFNCSSFASSGACKVQYGGSIGGAFFRINDAGSSSGALTAPTVTLVYSGIAHVGIALLYQDVVNVQAFTTSFNFAPNGQNIGLVFTNNTASSGGNTPTQFSGGAGCEAGLIQAFDGPGINTTYGVVFDNYSPVTSGGSFTYSTVTGYQSIQSPCNPNDGGPNFWFTTHLSSSPVPLNSPSSSQGTTTGDTYNATLTYDGSTLTINMYDVTASGSCPGASCYTQTISNLSIPSIVGSTTAYVGVIAGVGTTTSSPLVISQYSYTVDSPTATPSFAAWNANSTTNPGTTTAATPTYSIAPGTYSSTQSVTMSTSTSGGNICYLTSSTVPALLPQTDNLGGCQVGTAYTGAVSIPSTTTLYAIAGTSGASNPSAVTAGTYTIIAPTRTITMTGKITMTGTGKVQ